MNDTKRDDHVPGEEPEERIGTEVELDDFDDIKTRALQLKLLTRQLNS